jgi:hypothetical protein
MPNIKKYKERVCYSFNTDRELITKIQQTAKRRGVTTSEYITNLMREAVQKNEVGAANPLNISYGSHSYNNIRDQTLDGFMKPEQLQSKVNATPEQSIRFAFFNHRKLMLLYQNRLEGKSTL